MNQYSVSYFQDYFNNKNETFVLDNNNLIELYNKEKLIKRKRVADRRGGMEILSRFQEK